MVIKWNLLKLICSVSLWHMPHGISPLHSTLRSSRCCSPLWDTSTSIPISTVTQPKYHIDILSYKLSFLPSSWPPSPWANYCLFWHFFSSPMEVPAPLPSPLSPTFSSTKSSNIFIAEMGFWLGTALANTVRPQELIISPQEWPTAPRHLSSWLLSLLAALLISDGGTCRVNKATLANTLQTRAPIFLLQKLAFG